MSMRFFKAVDRMNEREMVSSYSPENLWINLNGRKERIKELTNFIICRNALKYTNESLKRECPPGMHRAIKQKVVGKVEGHMMIWMQGILGKELL